MLWLLACRSPEPLPQPPPPQTTVWRLSGRVTAEDSTQDALPFAGGHDLLDACGGATPCAAERWVSESGAQAILLVRGDRVVWGEQHWPATWRRLGTELNHCLGGTPLASPPAGDPGGYRMLAATDPPASDPSAEWLLHFSGANPCQLSGELLFSATRDRADSRDLLSGGIPWSEGGRAHANALLRAHYEALEAP